MSAYVVTVMVQTRETQQMDKRLTASLQSRHVGVDASAQAWVEFNLTIEARNLSEACAKAANMVRSTTGADPLSCFATLQDGPLSTRDPREASLGRHAG